MGDQSNRLIDGQRRHRITNDAFENFFRRRRSSVVFRRRRRCNVGIVRFFLYKLFENGFLFRCELRHQSLLTFFGGFFTKNKQKNEPAKEFSSKNVKKLTDFLWRCLFSRAIRSAPPTFGINRRSYVDTVRCRNTPDPTFF